MQDKLFPPSGGIFFGMIAGCDGIVRKNVI